MLLNTQQNRVQDGTGAEGATQAKTAEAQTDTRTAHERSIQEAQVRKNLSFPTGDPANVLEAQRIPYDKLGPVNQHMQTLQKWNSQFAERLDDGLKNNEQLRLQMTGALAKAGGFTAENAYELADLKLKVVDTENKQSNHPIALITLSDKDGTKLLEFSVSRMHNFVTADNLGDFYLADPQAKEKTKAPEANVEEQEPKAETTDNKTSLSIPKNLREKYSSPAAIAPTKEALAMIETLMKAHARNMSEQS